MGLGAAARGLALVLLAGALGLGSCRRPEDRGSAGRRAPPLEVRPLPSPHAARAAHPSGLPAPTAPDAGAGAGSAHLALGTPVDADPSDDLLIVRPQYALSYNPRRNDPNWVSWQLDDGWMGRTPRRKGRFLADASLPPGVYRVEDRDYAGSGFDRGHMARSQDRSRSPGDMEATFLLTNVLPQTHALNAGPWLRLEEHAEELARDGRSQLHIVSGGIFGKRPATIGKGVAVPESCFKIIVVLQKGQGARDVDESTRVIAVVMPNREGILEEPWGPYRVSVAEVEKQSGYRFLSAVPEVVRGALASRVDQGPSGGRRPRDRR